MWLRGYVSFRNPRRYHHIVLVFDLFPLSAIMPMDDHIPQAAPIE